MLIPQFSLRRLLATITGCSLIFFVISLAVRGQIWAIAVSIGLLSLLIASLLHGFVFFLVWLFSVVRRRRKPIAETLKTVSLILLVIMGAKTSEAGGNSLVLPMNG